MKKAKHVLNIDSRLKKIFIIAAFGAAFAQVIPILTHMIQQYPTNRNMSGFYMILLASLLAPLTYFFVSYIGSLKIKSQLDRLFYSTFITVIALFGYVAIWQTTRYVANLTQTTYDMFTFEFLPFIVVLTALIVYQARTHKQL